MFKYLQVFLDRLAQRLIVVASRLVASSVDTLHATQQAAEQSKLEDLARSYESDGKLEIAATLRARAIRLADASPADDAIATLQSVVDDGLTSGSLPDARSADQSWPLALPDVSNSAPTKPRRKKAKRSASKRNDAPILDNSTDSTPSPLQ